MTHYLKAPNNYTAQVGAPPEHSKTVKKEFCEKCKFLPHWLARWLIKNLSSPLCFQESLLCGRRRDFPGCVVLLDSSVTVDLVQSAGELWSRKLRLSFDANSVPRRSSVRTRRPSCHEASSFGPLDQIFVRLQPKVPV